MTWLDQFRRFVGGMIPIRGARASDDGKSVVIDPTASGVDRALQSAAFWACTRLISCSIGSLPSHVFEETAEGKVKAKDHPYYKMLTTQPNPWMTMPQLVQTIVMHLLTWGNSFVLPDLIDGEAVGLWPLQPERMTFLWNPDGTPDYRYVQPDGKVVHYTSADLIHFRVFTLDGFNGLGPLDYHRLTMDFESASQLYAANLYKNGGRPSGVLEYPGSLKDGTADKIRSAWQQIHSGAAGAGRVAVLENGTKYTAVSTPLSQMEYIASQKFSVEQIARIMGVAPHLIGAMDKPTYASVEQQSLETLRYTFQPIITSVERSIESRLLEPPFIFRINVNGFERSDIRSRYLAYSQARQWGWMSVNDIRELEDTNRIGPDGDIYLQPLNMAQAATNSQELGVIQE